MPVEMHGPLTTWSEEFSDFRMSANSLGHPVDRDGMGCLSA